MPVALIAAGGQLLGGFLQGRSAKKAAEAQARATAEAARLAAEEARFRPVGITTRFGQSQFQFGPEGRLSGASYELSPEARAFQDRLFGLAGGGLTQAEQAQAQFAPLATGAQGLFGLGQQYLAESPEQAAQRYMASQQELLAPSRERKLAQLQNTLFQQGRSGLSVGATGARPSGAAGLGATTPEMEAYYNALAQQDAALAAQAMQAGQEQTRFGAGLMDTAGNLLTQGYRGQVEALDPYKAYLGGVSSLESFGQQPMDIGINLGAKGQSTSVADTLLRGGTASAAAERPANTYNPFASALAGGGESPALKGLLERLFSKPPTPVDMTGFRVPYTAPTYQFTPSAPTLGSGTFDFGPSSYGGGLGSGTWGL